MVDFGTKWDGSPATVRIIEQQDRLRWEPTPPFPKAWYEAARRAADEHTAATREHDRNERRRQAQIAQAVREALAARAEQERGWAREREVFARQQRKIIEQREAENAKRRARQVELIERARQTPEFKAWQQWCKQWPNGRRNLGRPIDMGGPRDVWLHYVPSAKPG